MSDTPFVSLDAKWLFELSQRLPDDMLADVIRLSEIALRHEHLDEQVRNLQSASKSDDYLQGARDMARRIYSRSNIPVADRAPQVAIRSIFSEPTVTEINGVKVKKIPRGVSAFTIEPEKPKAPKPRAVNPKLAGLKLDLSKLRKVVEE